MSIHYKVELDGAQDADQIVEATQAAVDAAIASVEQEDEELVIGS